MSAVEKNPELERFPQDGDQSAEGALRPLSLDEFIGQKELRENLDTPVHAGVMQRCPLVAVRLRRIRAGVQKNLHDVVVASDHRAD